MQIHHIIPREVSSEVKALCPGFNLDDSENLIALPDQNHSGNIPQNKWFGKTKHQGSHAGYIKCRNCNKSK